jgi:ribosome maturation factor RimP
MLGKEEIMRRLEPLVTSLGLKIYDVETPQGTYGVLRVFLSNEKWGAQGVSLQACTRVAREINERADIEELVPGECTIEVSSPGIERKLTREEHFTGAVGERVKVVYAPSGEVTAATRERRTIKGTLEAYENNLLKIQAEARQGGELCAVPKNAVIEAHVDFIFKDE